MNIDFNCRLSMTIFTAKNAWNPKKRFLSGDDADGGKYGKKALNRRKRSELRGGKGRSIAGNMGGVAAEERLYQDGEAGAEPSVCAAAAGSLDPKTRPMARVRPSAGGCA